MTTITLTATELAEIVNAAINAGAEEFARAAKLPQAKFQAVLLGIPFKQARNRRRVELVEQKTKKKGA